MGCHQDVEPISNPGRPTCVVRSEERCHEQRHSINASGLDGQQRGNIEAAFRYYLCDRRCCRDVWLGVSLRLAHRPSSKVAVGLGQIFSYPAANHNPECKVYFQRDPHRASPHLSV